MIPGIYGVFPTSDGWIAIVGIAETRPAILLPDHRAGPIWIAQFDQLLYFEEDRAALWPILDEVFAQKPTAEWCRVLGDAGLRFAPVRDHAEVAADPGVRANGYITRVAGSTEGTADQEIVRPPVRFAGQETAPAAVDIPELGQHTEEILLENGFSWDDIGSLSADGAI